MKKIFYLLVIAGLSISFNAQAIDLVSQAQKEQLAENKSVSKISIKKEQAKAALEKRKAEDAKKKAELRRESKEFRQEILDMHENLSEQ